MEYTRKSKLKIQPHLNYDLCPSSINSIVNSYIKINYEIVIGRYTIQKIRLRLIDLKFFLAYFYIIFFIYIRFFLYFLLYYIISYFYVCQV